VSPAGGPDTPAEPKRLRPSGRRDAGVEEARSRVHKSLIEDLGPLIQDREIAPPDLRVRVRERLAVVLARGEVRLSPGDRAQLINDVADDILGYGPIDRYLHDDTVTEVMVNGPSHIYVERDGEIDRVPESFVDEAHLRRIVDKIVSQVGRRIDESTPMVDARLPDGSRVNAVAHPLSIGGPFLTIRKFSEKPLTMTDLIRSGTVTQAAATFLEACVAGRLNIVVSGGTGAGKTTLLNVLSESIGERERIVTIEDAKELQLRQEHVLPMEARPPNIEGKGQVTIRDLVRNALRMRPNRIIVGEVRGGEALDMLQAMNSGHDGSLATVHANTTRDVTARIETMTLMAGFDLPVRAIRDQIASAIDLIVQMARFRDGSRRVTNITEVTGMEDDAVALQEVFAFDYAAGIDSDGRFRGTLHPVGTPPRVLDRLAEAGVHVPTALFAEPPPVRPKPRARR
jgi:pilus assembly protein CpaF